MLFAWVLLFFFHDLITRIIFANKCPEIYVAKFNLLNFLNDHGTKFAVRQKEL